MDKSILVVILVLVLIIIHNIATIVTLRSKKTFENSSQKKCSGVLFSEDQKELRRELNLQSDQYDEYMKLLEQNYKRMSVIERTSSLTLSYLKAKTEDEKRSLDVSRRMLEEEWGKI